MRAPEVDSGLNQEIIEALESKIRAVQDQVDKLGVKVDEKPTWKAVEAMMVKLDKRLSK